MVKSSCPQDIIERAANLYNLVVNSPYSSEIPELANDLANDLASASCSLTQILTLLRNAVNHLEELLDDIRKKILLQGNEIKFKMFTSAL